LRDTLKSQVNGREYVIAVVLPQGYTVSANAITRYPVLYLLDGGIALPTASAAYKAQARSRDSVIFVGVESLGAAGRRIDYTLPLWGGSNKEFLDMSRVGTCCGAARFLRVLREEIIPLIDRRYRTTGDRGIFGHSFGGLFANYVLFEAPDLFERYAISSASLGMDNMPLFRREVEFARDHTSLPKQVFSSVGSEEGPFMRYVTQRMAASPRARNYQGLTVTSVVVQGASHFSMAVDYNRALQALYLPNRVPEPAEAPDVADSARRITQAYVTAYARLSTDGILDLVAGDSSFHGIIRGTMVDGRGSYGALLRQRFAPIRSMEMRVKNIQVDADSSEAIATASYTLLTRLRSGQSIWDDGEVTLMFEKRSEGWRITYVLDAGSPPTD
jgi:predicted alpha/beta superfamily hydrolase